MHITYAKPVIFNIEIPTCYTHEIGTYNKQLNYKCDRV